MGKKQSLEAALLKDLKNISSISEVGLKKETLKKSTKKASSSQIQNEYIEIVKRSEKIIKVIDSLRKEYPHHSEFEKEILKLNISSDEIKMLHRFVSDSRELFEVARILKKKDQLEVHLL